MYLHKIQHAVGKGAATYLLHHQIQHMVCQRLISLLTQQQATFNTMIDIACGVGASTQQLIETVQAKHYIATDLSKTALDIAKQMLPHHINLINADFHRPLLCNLDLAFCNMGLQWSTNLEQTLRVIKASLRTQGILAFSMPVAGTFHELKPENRLELIDENVISALLRQLKFDTLTSEIHIKTIDFISGIDAIRSLKLTGTNINFTKMSKHLRTKQHIDDYFVDKHQFQLTYRTVLFVVRKG